MQKSIDSLSYLSQQGMISDVGTAMYEMTKKKFKLKEEFAKKDIRKIFKKFCIQQKKKNPENRRFIRVLYQKRQVEHRGFETMTR